MRLGHLHAHQVAKALQQKALDRKLVCPDCGRELEPAAWSFHRKQRCTAPATAQQEAK